MVCGETSVSKLASRAKQEHARSNYGAAWTKCSREEGSQRRKWGVRTIGSPPVLETKSVVSNLVDGDVVWISEQTSPISSPPGSGTLYIVTSSYDPLTKEVLWKFSNNDSPPEVELQNLNVGATPETGDQIRTVTLTVTAVLSDGSTLVWDRLSPTPKHVRDGVADSRWKQSLRGQALLAWERRGPCRLS